MSLPQAWRKSEAPRDCREAHAVNSRRRPEARQEPELENQLKPASGGKEYTP